jgi:hypothetical protein
VFGTEVRVVVRDTDRYGRTVGEVILQDGRNLNHKLVRAGLAWWYRQYAANDRALESLAREARAAKRGLWVEPAPTPALGIPSNALSTRHGPIPSQYTLPALRSRSITFFRHAYIAASNSPVSSARHRPPSYWASHQ